MTPYHGKPEHTMGELMKRAAKEATGKVLMQKKHVFGNIFLTNRKASTNEAAKSELSLHMRNSNRATEFVPIGLKK